MCGVCALFFYKACTVYLRPTCTYHVVRVNRYTVTGAFSLVYALAIALLLHSFVFASYEPLQGSSGWSA